MKKLVLILFLTTPFLGFGQTSELGNWLLYFGNKKINNQWNLHHEVQYRNYDAVGDLEQLLLRTGLGYRINDHNSNFLLGYGFILSENYVAGLSDKVEVNEHRIFQQFITRQKFNRIGVQHRYRFEQRFVEDDFKVRFRYFLALNLPLNNTELTDGTVYLAAYNEIFLNGEQSAYDRNRLYGGIGYRLNAGVRFEVGYMNQFLRTQNRDQINLITFVSF